MFHVLSRKKRDQSSISKGFALATVLIVSGVMLTVLVVAVSSTAAVRVALQSQYYNSLTKTAAESGVAYGKSCINDNTSNIGAPSWNSSTNPLLPNSDCTGAVRACASATTADCTITVNGNVTSTFSVIALDSNGNPITNGSSQAASLVSTGIVNIYRTSQLSSTSTPWRTYKQTSTVSLITPNVCAANSAATVGWTNAALAPASGFSDPQATPISIASSLSSDGSTTLPGIMYYRKDFTLANAGTYTLTTLADDRGDVFIDGQYVQTAIYSATASNSVNLSSGCHTIVVKVTNNNATPNPTKLTLSLVQNGMSKDALVTDTTWRVIAGPIVNYGQAAYFDDTKSGWSPARILGQVGVASTYSGYPSDWATDSGDAYAQWISLTNTSNGTGGPYASTYPYASYTDLRSNNGFTMPSAGAVNVTLACDDSCTLYLDGQSVLNATTYKTSVTASLSVSAGKHEFSILLYNGGTSVNASAVIMSAIRTSDNVTVDKTDASWESTNKWTSTDPYPQSYDETFVPAGIPATLCPCGNVTNLIPNSTFDSGTSGWIARNVNLGTSTTGAVSVPSSSSYALSVQPNGSSSDTTAGYGNESSTAFAVPGMAINHTYLLRGTVTVPAGGLTGALDGNGKIIGLTLWYYESNYSAYNFAMAKAPNKAGTYQLSLTVQIPADATGGFLRLYNGDQSGGGNLYWDNISLEDITSSIPSPYFIVGTSPYYPGLQDPNFP